MTDEFNELAEEYKENKVKTIENLLIAGKLITKAKHELGHGQFLNWIGDSRVSESHRTSQRFMAVYSDFGHLLDHKNKLEAFNSLGVTGLLELKKLPDRFKKEIEIIYQEEGEEKREIKKVIDEDKLGDFLDDPIEYKGKMIKVGLLPVPELSKKIREVSGVYEPDDMNDVSTDSGEEGGEPESSSVAKTEKPVDPKLGILNEKLSSLLDLSMELIKQCDEVDAAAVSSAIDEDKDELKNNIDKFKSHLESIYVKLDNVSNLL